jgi:hypothetical protein
MQHVSNLNGHHHTKYLLKHIKDYTGCPKKIVPFSKIQSVQLTPLSTHWAPRKKKLKKRFNLFRTPVQLQFLNSDLNFHNLVFLFTYLFLYITRWYYCDLIKIRQ